MSAAEKRIEVGSNVAIGSTWTREIISAGLTSVELELRIPSLLAHDPVFGGPCAGRVDYTVSAHPIGGYASGGFLGSFDGRSTAPFSRRVVVDLPEADTGWLVSVAAPSANGADNLCVVGYTERT